MPHVQKKVRRSCTPHARQEHAIGYGAPIPRPESSPLPRCARCRGPIDGTPARHRTAAYHTACLLEHNREIDARAARILERRSA